MDARKTGIAMIVAGGVAQLVGIITDSIHHANNAAARAEGIFDLTKLPHAIFFSGIMVAALGVVMLFAGPWLYASERTPARSFAQVLVPILAVASIAGCAAAANRSSLAKGNGAKAAAAATPTTVAAHDMANMTDAQAHSHDAGSTATTSGGSTAHSMDMGTVIAETADGTSPCEQASPKPASPGEVGSGGGGAASNTDAEGGHGHRGMVKQLPLTNAERALLKQQMIQARSVIDKYPTVKDALAAGYQKSTPYVPCIGAHYTNLGLISKFDPAAPSELLYDGTDPDSKIVGLSYLVFHANGPPPGFAGPNDHFHQHNANGGLCLNSSQGVIGGEAMSEAQCTALGGKKSGKLMANIWMAHAWVAPGWECSWGVFAGECPELGGKLGGTAQD